MHFMAPLGRSLRMIKSRTDLAVGNWPRLRKDVEMLEAGEVGRSPSFEFEP